MPFNSVNGKCQTKGLTRREVLKYGLYTGCAAGLSGGLLLSGCGKAHPKKKPNVILIVIDSLRADHLSCYGYHRNTTPNIDKLANEGLVFRNAISQAPWTLPSIASMFTSQYPSVLGVFDKPTIIDARFPLLSQVFKQHNYTTQGIVSHVLVSANLGFGRGFDNYDEQCSLGRYGISSPAITDKIRYFLSKKQDKPFFLFAHYFDPHYNYFLHDKYDYYPSYRGDSVQSGESILKLWGRRHSLTKEDITYLLALYDSEIAFTDEYIGIVLGELKKQGFYDNSIIIITADHGEEFMERGWIGHCINLYQNLIHVPLIIKVPGCRAGVIDSPIGLIDIAPTIYKYADLEIPEWLDGQALNLSSGGSIANTPILSETFNSQIYQPGVVEPIALRSIILGDRKLIYDQRKNIKRIYDLSKDPDEHNDISSQPSTLNKKLEELLSKWLVHMKTKRKADLIHTESELFTPEQIKQLKSLGYL